MSVYVLKVLPSYLNTFTKHFAVLTKNRYLGYIFKDLVTTMPLKKRVFASMIG